MIERPLSPPLCRPRHRGNGARGESGAESGARASSGAASPAEPQPDRVRSRSRSKFFENGAHVRADRVHRAAERAGDFLICFAVAGEPEDFNLSRRQRSGAGWFHGGEISKTRGGAASGNWFPGQAVGSEGEKGGSGQLPKLPKFELLGCIDRNCSSLAS